MRRGMFLLILFVAFSAASAADDFVLARYRVGKLEVGMPESAIFKVYPRQITKKIDLESEGFSYPAVQVFLTKDRRNPSLVIDLDESESRIYSFEVLDSRFKTAKGLGVGSTFGQLRSAEKHLSFGSGEGAYGVFAEDLSMTFFLELDRATEHSLYEPNVKYTELLSKIPDATKIKSIGVYRLPTSAAPAKQR